MHAVKTTAAHAADSTVRALSLAFCSEPKGQSIRLLIVAPPARQGQTFREIGESPVPCTSRRPYTRVMLAFLLSWLVLSASVWATALVLPGFTVKSFKAAIWVAAAYGLLDWALGRVFFHMISLGTLGIGYLFTFLTRWLVKAVLLKLTDWLLTALTVRSFGTAVVGALVMTIVQMVGEAAVKWLL